MTFIYKYYQTRALTDVAHNHKVEINYQVMRKLDIFKQKLLNKYNRVTFSRFMQDLSREHDERVKANQRLHHEIEDLKIQVQETEKIFNIPEIEF